MLIYTMPETYGGEECLCVVEEADIDLCQEETTSKDGYPCAKDLFELCCILVDELNLEITSDPDDAVLV
jgi:hypothetical protein